MSVERSPNILITGTPGTGKTTLANAVVALTSLNYLGVNDLAKDGELYDGFDDVNNCHILDEDRVLDEMEDSMSLGGQIVDYHSCNLFPERWFDVVFVLRTDNTILYPRLNSRNYSANKISDLIHCEIVQVVVDEARDSYNTNIVHELSSNTLEDMDNNVTQISQWIKQWNSNQ